MEDKKLLIEQILLNMKYDSKKTLSENKETILKKQILNEAASDPICIKWRKISGMIITPNTGDIQKYLNAVGYTDVKVDYAFGNGTATALWTHFFGSPKKTVTAYEFWKKLNEYSKIEGIPVSIGTVPGVGYITLSFIVKVIQKIIEKRLTQNSCDKGPSPGAIQHLNSLGCDTSGAASDNHAYALAAMRATKKAADTLQRRGLAADVKYSICVRAVGSTCPPGSFRTFDVFDLDMANAVNRLNPMTFEGKPIKPPQYVYLTNFYFDWGKIMADINNAFTGPYSNPNSSSFSPLFPDGWYGWFVAYWGTDNCNQIQSGLLQKPASVQIASTSAGGGFDIPASAETPYTMWSTEFLHDMFTVAEVGTLVAGFAFPPAAPLLFGASSIFGAADASTYFAEGNNYMGAMMLGLEVIPGGELIKIFKTKKLAAQVVEEYGELGAKNLLEKGLKKELKTAKEIADFNKLVKEKDKIGTEIAQKLQKQAEETVDQGFGKNYLQMANKGQGIYGHFVDHVKLWFEALYTLYKASGMSAAFTNAVSKMAISVGGTMWGIDQLYLALYGKTEDRQKSDIRKLYYLLQGQGLPEKEDLANELDKLPKEKAEDAAKRMMTVTRLTEEGIDSRMGSYLTQIYNNNVKRKKPGYAGSGKEIVIPTPSLNDVINGTRKFSYGMESDDLLEIKKRLKLNYGDSLNPKINETRQNNKFDDALLDVIIDFQTRVVKDFYNVELNEKGIIGLETYNAIINNPLQNLELKPISMDDLEKDKYDYFSWNPRLQTWDSISYDSYKEKSSIGSKVEKRLKQQELQGLDKSDPTADMSKRKKRKYDKKYEEMKKYYEQLKPMKSLTPEQQKFLDDFDNYYNA